MKFATEADAEKFRSGIITELKASGMAKTTGRSSFLIGARVDCELPKYFGSKLPRSSRAAIEPVTGDKHARWRAKCREAGNCPRCGKPASPWINCEDCRLSRKILNALSILARRGEICRVGRGLYQAKKEASK
jgi:hypothetical protein